jgi:hypothetical protein
LKNALNRGNLSLVEDLHQYRPDNQAALRSKTLSIGRLSERTASGIPYGSQMSDFIH